MNPQAPLHRLITHCAVQEEVWMPAMIQPRACCVRPNRVGGYSPLKLILILCKGLHVHLPTARLPVSSVLIESLQSTGEKNLLPSARPGHFFFRTVLRGGELSLGGLSSFDGSTCGAGMSLEGAGSEGCGAPPLASSSAMIASLSSSLQSK